MTDRTIPADAISPMARAVRPGSPSPSPSFGRRAVDDRALRGTRPTRRRIRFLRFLRFLLSLLASGGAAGPGRTQESPADPRIPAAWLDVQPGALPIIVGAPHGGELRPPELPDRSVGVLLRDAGTDDLARRLADELGKRFGRRPHLVICRVHRAKVDCNRDLPEAARGHPLAEALWRSYQGAVREAAGTVGRDWGMGLYLDLHGQSHPSARVEWGYRLRAADLRRPDAGIDADPALAAAVSVRDVVVRSGRPLSEVIRGPRSLGGLLERAGFPSVPSPAHPHPGDGPYFSGGYNVLTHGSGGGGRLSAVQVEAPRRGVRDTAENRQRFAAALAGALGEWFREHVRIDLSTASAAGKAVPGR